MYKYDDEHLILLSKEKMEYNLIILKAQNNDLIKHCIIKTKLKFTKNYIRGYSVNAYNDKFIFTLKDKRIIVLCYHKMYVVKLFQD